jgi:N-succinyldiaminopimelate aminotransferase
MADPFPAFESFHPFTRLARLLAGIEPPSGLTPLVLSLGEPQGTPPAFVAEAIAREAAGWGRYPAVQGTPEFRRAVHDWLTRRFKAPASLIDPDKQILPVAGSREALFMATQVAVARANRERPLVLLPNPFYHVYAGAIAAAGAEPLFLPATRANNFLPTADGLDPKLLARVACAIVCSPTNPQGAVADRAWLENWIALARRSNFTVLFDECYSEIWRGTEPAGALDAIAALGGTLDNILIVHSLSKRSGAPGLRSGFIAGDAVHVARQMQLINYGGVTVPAPIVAASAALWRDEAHVVANRAHYDAIFKAASGALEGRFGYTTPAGSFFAWLEVGDDEAATQKLWREAAIRVLPGSYMGRPDSNGVNPGDGFIRVALVHEPAIVGEAMEKLVAVLGDTNVRRIDPRHTQLAAGSAA